MESVPPTLRGAQAAGYPGQLSWCGIGNALLKSRFPDGFQPSSNKVVQWHWQGVVPNIPGAKYQRLEPVA